MAGKHRQVVGDPVISFIQEEARPTDVSALPGPAAGRIAFSWGRGRQ